MKDALKNMDTHDLGVTLILKADEIVTGIITDGDIRRLVLENESIYDLRVEDGMTKNPRTVQPDSPVYDALNIMEDFQITVLPVTDQTGKLRGVLHLHDILGKGEFKFNGS
jgi:arabinose-5-phosphate isomerase